MTRQFVLVSGFRQLQNFYITGLIQLSTQVGHTSRFQRQNRKGRGLDIPMKEFPNIVDKGKIRKDQ